MVHPHGGPKMHFVVMGNIFAQSLEIHERYDLKGSTIGRTVGEEKLKNLKPTTILKDLDFQRNLILGPEKRALFFDQLERDSQVRFFFFLPFSLSHSFLSIFNYRS